MFRITSMEIIERSEITVLAMHGEPCVQQANVEVGILNSIHRFTLIPMDDRMFEAKTVEIPRLFFFEQRITDIDRIDRLLIRRTTFLSTAFSQIIPCATLNRFWCFGDSNRARWRNHVMNIFRENVLIFYFKYICRPDFLHMLTMCRWNRIENSQLLCPQIVIWNDLWIRCDINKYNVITCNQSILQWNLALATVRMLHLRPHNVIA